MKEWEIPNLGSSANDNKYSKSQADTLLSIVQAKEDGINEGFENGYKVGFDSGLAKGIKLRDEFEANTSAVLNGLLKSFSEISVNYNHEIIKIIFSLARALAKENIAGPSVKWVEEIKDLVDPKWDDVVVEVSPEFFSWVKNVSNIKTPNIKWRENSELSGCDYKINHSVGVLLSSFEQRFKWLQDNCKSIGLKND